MTVTGKTLGENLERWTHAHGELEFSAQDVIRPLEKPIKETGHIRWVGCVSMRISRLLRRGRYHAGF
jgi:dihydroxyacid dehydratase/phosphogluconate dehydratase